MPPRLASKKLPYYNTFAHLQSLLKSTTMRLITISQLNTPKTWIASNIPSDLSVLQLLHGLVKFGKTNHGRFEAEFTCQYC
jgi:hypothetical protein